MSRIKTKKCLMLRANKDKVSEVFIAEKELPELNSTGVLIQIKACAINSMDTELEKIMLFNQTLENNEDISAEYSVGQDIAGVVKAIGCDVSSVQIGDRVAGIIPLDYSQSGCASYVILQEFDIVMIPNGVTFSEAASSIGDAVSSYTALHYLGKLVSDTTVLILGCNTSLAIICMQLARHWGASVIAAIGSDPKDKQNILCFAPDNHIININDLKNAVMTETGNMGVDLILDLQSNKTNEKVSTHEILSCLAVGGRWVTIKSDLQLDPPNCRQLFLRCASVGFLFEQAWMLSSSQQGRYQHILMDIMEKISNKIIIPNITTTWTSLDDIATIMQSKNETTKYGKSVLCLT